MKKVLFLLFVTLCKMSSAQVDSITIDTQTFSLGDSATFSDNDSSTILNYRVSHLYHLNAFKCPQASMDDIYDILMGETNPTHAANILGQPVRIDLFTDNSIMTTTVNISDIKSFAVVMYDNVSDKLIQYYLRPKASGFHIDPRLTSFVKNWPENLLDVLHYNAFVGGNDLPATSVRYTFKITSNTLTLTSYTPTLLDNIMGLQCDNNGMKVLDVRGHLMSDRIYEERYNANRPSGQNGCSQTVPGCLNGNPEHWCVADIPYTTGHCESKPVPICGASAMLMKNAEYSIVPANSILITPLYSFRDEILYKCEKGKEYINSYYSLSNYISWSDLTITRVTNLIDYLPSLYDFIDRCINGEGESIMIDETFYEKTLTILDDFEGISNDERYLAIIQMVRDDLDLYLDVKKESVYTSLGISVDNFECATSQYRNVNNEEHLNKINNSIYGDITLEITPNPIVGSTTNIEVFSNVVGVVDIRVIDLSGKVHSHKTSTNLNKGKNTFTLDVSNFSAGYYLCTVIVNGRSKLMKPIIIN